MPFEEPQVPFEEPQVPFEEPLVEPVAAQPERLAEETTQDSRQRRILALFLPELLCELARGGTLSLDRPTEKPLGVVLAERQDDVRPSDPLASVCANAFRMGVRPGQTPAEATAQLAGMQIQVVEHREVLERLIAVAETAAQYGTSPSWTMDLSNAQQAQQKGQVGAAFDTVWLDITGVGHLYGGEHELCEELLEQVRLLGHRVRAAVAPGPRLAQALARFGQTPVQIIDAKSAARAVAELPLAALPLDAERIGWLGRLGIFSVGQIATLPAQAASTRLGPLALSILELVQGIDREPLVPGVFPRSLSEHSEWDEPAEGLSPLLFAVRGLVARLSARLMGRGEASCWLECEIHHDQAIARHRGVLSQTLLEFELSTPLYKEHDLERVLRSRLERCELAAPSVGITLRASQLTHQVKHQLGLSQRGSRSFQSAGSHGQEFPVLLAELQSDVGYAGVGVLSLGDSLIPEGRSILRPLLGKEATRKFRRSSALQSQKTGSSRNRASSTGIKPQAKWLNPCPSMDRITRLLPYPQSVNIPLRVGETFALGGELFTIERLQFLQRVGDTQWWQEHSVNRDYHWAWLRSPNGGTEALLFVDRTTGEGFVQALSD